MERKIGEIFEYNGEWYQCIGNPYNECTDCDFCFEIGRACVRQIVGQCSMSNRSDGLSVVFKKLEKVGEPYVAYGKVRQKYKLYIPLTITNGIIERDISCDDVHEIVDIANKQNKEDMSNTETLWYGPDKKEAKSLKLSNLKPFSLEAAKAGKPVCTRDGHKARIICFDRKGYNMFPIVALIMNGDRESDIYTYRPNGTWDNSGNESDKDLMMLPEKKEGWVNVYKDSVYDTKDEALIGRSEIRDYIDTIKISWEE